MIFDQKSAVHPVPGLIAGDNNKAMDIAIYKLNMPNVPIQWKEDRIFHSQPILYVHWW